MVYNSSMREVNDFIRILSSDSRAHILLSAESIWLCRGTFIGARISIVKTTREQRQQRGWGLNTAVAHRQSNQAI